MKKTAVQWLKMRVSLVAGVLGVLGAGGCDYLKAPPVDPTPQPPVVKAVVFDPKDGLTVGTALNNRGAAATAGLPNFFRVTQVRSGELVDIQSVKVIKPGPPAQEAPGVPDIAHLAGIVAPAPGQPGYAQSIAFVQSKTLGQDLDVELDPQFPTDLQGRRLIQIYYTEQSGELKGERLNLNRMMVREGYGVVDLYSPTSIDTKPWLNDEQFARLHRKGLWGLGIILQGRQPPPIPTGAQTRVKEVSVDRSGISDVKGASKRRTTTRTNIRGFKSGITISPNKPGASSTPGAPGGRPPGGASTAPPQGGPPQGAPPQGAPPQGGPPRGAPPQAGPPPGGPPPGGPPPGAPPSGRPPGGPPPGAPPRP